MVKIEESMAEKTAIKKPIYWFSTDRKTTEIPTRAIKPKIGSYILTFLFSRIGSKTLVQMEVVAIPAKQIDTFQTLAAKKNNIQWDAIILPVPKIA